MLTWGIIHAEVVLVEFEFEWRFYALLASKTIFRVVTYSHVTY